jgi:hypothetical protein
MKVVLTDRWERGRPTNLQARSRLAAIWLAQQLLETNSGTVAQRGDRSPTKFVVFLRERKQGAGHNHNSRPWVPLHFCVVLVTPAAAIPQLHTPCPLPRVEANEHWFCKAASSSSPRGPGSNVVSVTEKVDPPCF